MLSPAFIDWQQQRLNEHKNADLWRHHVSLQSPQSTKVRCENQTLVNFSSNDYLGLANHPLVLEAATLGLKKFGLGSGASHLICGHSEAHETLQQTIADWLGAEKVILFSSGYMANFALLTTLLEQHDLIVQDKLNHASLIDAGLSSKASMKRFIHNDPQSLAQQLKTQARFKMVVCDGVFSMDGDIAPLPNYLHQLEANSFIAIDDAHGLGVLGKKGQGTLSHFQLSFNQFPLLMGTFGKAIGTGGAFIATNKVLGEVFEQFARTHIYTTAIPPAIAAATTSSIEIIKSDDARRTRLKNNIQYCQQLAKELELPILLSETAIQPIILGESKLCVSIAKKLREHGFWVGAIRPPTVPKNTARLRLTLSSEHSELQISECLTLIKTLINNTV